MTTTSPIALITGANRGLGRHAALALACQGTDIILTYRSHADEAQAVVAEIEALGRRAVALQLDVTDADRFAAFADTVRETLASHWQRDRFDFLLNNAGLGAHASFAETTPAQFDQMVAVHLKGPFFLTQTLLPLIADGGRILNVSSGLTRFAMPGFAVYATMKGGIEVLTRYQAKELGGRGISVNTLAPVPSKPISAAARCATTRISTHWSPATLHWVVPACPTISVAWWQRCSAPAPDGSTRSASRHRAACSCRCFALLPSLREKGWG